MFRPAISGERKKFGLRSTRKPQLHDCLSGTCIVEQDGKVGVAYFGFDEAFVDALGRHLPVGISPDTPAYLRVVRRSIDDSWHVFVDYLTPKAVTNTRTLLWIDERRPGWLGRVIPM